MNNESWMDDIGERPLKYLAEIAATGGVRMAAEALSVNPSVVSRQIAALERRLRFPLIERRGRNVIVTEIGQVLIDYYRDGQRRQRDLSARLEEYRHLKRGRVAIGVGEGFIGRLIAQALQRFSMSYPDILVEIRSGPTPAVLSLVRDDVVDIGLCARSDDDPAMRIHPFAAKALCAVVAPTHRFAKMERVPPSELVHERLIFMTEAHGVQHFVHSVLDTARLNVTPAYRVDLFNTGCRRSGCRLHVGDHRAARHRTRRAGRGAHRPPDCRRFLQPDDDPRGAPPLACGRPSMETTRAESREPMN